MTYRTTIGAVEQPPPLPSGSAAEDPFIFSDLDRGIVCLKSQWAPYAQLCAQSHEGGPSAGVDPSVCAMFLSPERRATWYKLPICWEVNVETKSPTPFFSQADCDGEARAFHVQQMAECIRNPFASERCALYAHPSVIKLIQEACGGDTIFVEARKKAESAAFWRAMAWIAGGTAFAGAIYLAIKGRKTA